MKKFTSISAALLLGGFAMANAQDATLGTATITEPTGDYITSVPNITIQWMDDDDTAQEIKLVSGTSVTVNLNVAGNAATATATLYSPNTGNGQDPEDGVDGGTDADASTGYGLIVEIPFEEPFTTNWMPTPGKWVVTLNSGVVALASSDSDTNSEEELSFTVFGKTNLDPETNPLLGNDFLFSGINSYNQESLESLTFSWDDYTIDTVLGEITITEQTNNDGWCTDAQGAEAKELAYTISQDKSSLIFNLSTYSVGIYKIHFGENCILFAGDVIWGGGMDYYVNIFNGMATGTVIYPETNYASMFSNVIFSWGGQNITFAGDSQTVTVTLPSGDEEEVTAKLAYVMDEEGDHQPSTGVALLAEGDEEYNALVVDVFDLIQEYGNGSYEISVPEGLVWNEAQLINPGQSYELRVYPLAEDLAEITVNDENNIEVAYSDEYSYIDSTYAATIVVRDEEGEVVAQPYLFFMEGVATIYTSEYKDGNYELVIPEAALLMQNDDFDTFLNQEQVFYFSVDGGEVYESDWTGVEKLESVPAVVNGVYNLQGVKVADSYSNNLPKGLYIIDGKKVLVK